ncbi:MAG: ATP-binding protein [Dissulfurispiraceae bacterium]|jgi:two-component system sensor histidine kinase HydH|nr:ATP-binding protein [Dissulfurispiraceae bacterium]
MRTFRQGKTYRYLAVILLMFSLLTAASAYMTYNNSVVSAEEGLRLQAIAVASGLEAVMQKSPAGSTDIFAEIAARGAWEAIAFVGLYAPDGTIIAHSNKNLVNKKVDGSDFSGKIKRGVPSFGMLKLGTDEKVFVLDLPVEGRQELLRVALHTYPADRTIQQARRQVITIAGLILLLWITGFFFVRYAKRSEALTEQMHENERFTMLGEMASVLAHEIRNPLGSIKGFAQYLLESKEGSADNSEAMFDNLGIIVSESERLEALTDDLLLYARPAAVEIKQVNLKDLAAETVMSAMGRQHMDNQGRVHILIEKDLVINTDRYKLFRIMLNLIRNADEATGGSGQIWISAETTDGKVHLSVRDNGPGMDSDTAVKVFDPFFTTKAKGTGLGLAVVNKLVRELGGEISLNTNQGSGAEFVVLLPKRMEDE